MRFSTRPAFLVVLSLSLSFLARADDPSPQELQLRERYEKALLANPSRGTAFERLYQSYADNEGPAVWAAQLAKQAGEQPNRAAYPLILGFLQERLAHEPEALAAYSQAIERDGSSARSFAARGYLHWHMRKFDAAAVDLRKAIDLNPPRDEAQDLLKTLGRVQAAAGDTDGAKKTWMELVERYPDDTMILEELAELLADEGQIDDAIAQYEKLRMAADDDYLKLKSAQQVAEMKIQQQKFDEATAIYSELLDNLAPGSWLRDEARRSLEEAYRRKGDNEGIVRYYTKWMESHPDDVEMQVALGDAFRGLQQNEKAEETYRKVIERAPSRADAREALAETLLDQGKQTQAAEQYRVIAEAMPGEAEVWERLGSVLFDDATRPEAERRADAIAAWRNIFAQRPTDPTRAVRAAEVFRSRQCEAEALEHYRKAIELAPEDLAHYEYLGDYLHQLGRKDEALATWRKMVEGPRATLDNWKRLAETLSSAAMRPEALDAVEQGLKLAQRPQDGFALVALKAGLFVDDDKLDAARAAIDDLAGRCETPAQLREVMARRVELYRRAGRLNDEIDRLAGALHQAGPATAAAQATPAARALDFELLARMMQAVSRTADAIKAVEQANALDGRSPERLALTVELYRGAGNRLAAVETLRKLIAVDPREESSHLEAIIELSRQQGQSAEAIKAAERLVEISPDADRGYLVAADLQWAAGQSEAALATLRRGIRKAPKEITLQLALARRLMDLNRLQLALDQFWRAFQMADDDAKRLAVTTEMARVYYATGQFDRLIDRLIEWRRDPEVEAVAALALSVAYKEANRPERAEQELERALSRRPSDTNTLEQLVDMAERSGRTEQAIQYAEKLATLRPTDAKLASRLGGLLFQAGRTAEAVAKWRAAMQLLGGDDPAGRALELAETLLRYDLGGEAQQALIEASNRFPDDWRLKFRLAMQLKQEQQLPRAARLLDEIVAMKPPGPDDPASAAAKKKKAGPPAYARPGDPGLTSPLIDDWVNLLTVIQRTGTDCESHALAHNRYYSRYAYRGYNSYYGGNRSTLNYMPDSFPAARTAALVQRLHLSELDGKLPEALAALARRAGLDLSADDFVDAAKQLITPAQQRGADAPAAPPVKVLVPGADEAARLDFLRALIAVNLHDLCWNTASAFFKATPADKPIAALLTIYATGSRESSASANSYSSMARIYQSSSYSFAYAMPAQMMLLSQASGYGGGYRRPRALDRADFDIEPILNAFAVSDPNAALTLAGRYAEDLIGRNRRAEGLRWVRWVLERKPGVDLRLTMMQQLLLAEQPDKALGLLPELRRDIRAEVQKSTTAGTNPGWGYNQRLLKRQQYAALLGSIAEEFFRQGKRADALDLVSDWLDLTAVEGRTGLSPGAQYASAFSLDPSDVVKFPSAGPLFDDERLGELRAWVERAKTAGMEPELQKRLEARLGAAEGDARPDAALALAILEGFDEKFEDAARRLQEAVVTTDDDRLRLALAQVLVQLEKPDDALEPLGAIRLRVGPIFKDAQVGLLKIAAKLNQQELGRKAAQQLIGMRLDDEERFALVPYVKKLELAQQAATLALPGRQSNRGGWQPLRGGSSRFRNMGAVAGRQMETLARLSGDAANRDAVVALARRIIAEKIGGLDLNTQDQELRGAIRAIKQVGAIDAEIKRLEGDLASNPKSTDALLALYLIYSNENDVDKAQAYIDRAFDLLPGNMRLRYQHALMLAGNGKPAEAVRQLERVLREAPWVIDDGGTLANAFREVSRLGDLVDLATRIDPVPQVSLENRSAALDWLGQIAATIQQDQPELAQRLWRRQRDLATSVPTVTQLTLQLIDQFVKHHKLDEITAELPRLLPGPIGRNATDEKTRRDRLRSLSVQLFHPENDGGEVMYSDRPMEYSPRARQLVALFKEGGRLGDIEKFIAEGEQDADWKEFIGRGLHVFAGLAAQPPDLAPARQLADFLIQRKDENQVETQSWRVPFQQGLVETLANERELLPVAAALAADLQPRLDERSTEFRDRLALLDVQARAQSAAGAKAAARALYEKLAKLEDPQYSRYRGMRGGNGWYWWQEFQTKQPFFEKMLDDGVTDLPIEALFRTMSNFGDNESWMIAQAEQILGKWLARPAVHEALAAEIERLEKKHAEKPDDMAVINHLGALYRAAGRPEKVEELMTRLSSGDSVSGQKAVLIADQLYRAGKRDEARALLLKQLAEGFTDPQALQQHAAWFNNPAAAEALAATIEKLPREARFIQNGDWWIDNLANMFGYMQADRSAGDELAMRRVGLRIRVVSDDFSRASQNQYGDTRARLAGLVDALIALNQPEEAYTRLLRAIFDSKNEGLPELTLGALFDESGQTHGGRPTRLARTLARLAIRLDKVGDLRARIDARRKTDVVWEDTALRLLAMLDLELGDHAAAEATIRAIAKRPPPASFDGADLSLAALAADLGDRPELRPLSIELLDKLVEQLRGRNDGDWQSMRYGFQLARLYMESGDLEKARKTFGELRDFMPDYVRLQGMDFNRSMGANIAAVWLAGGHVEQAVRALRNVLAAPLGETNYYIPIGDDAQQRAPESALGDLVELIARLDQAGKLDAQIDEARSEWAAAAEKAPGRRDCEPLVFIAACQLRRGRVADAVTTLKSLDPRDYPPSLPLLVECAAAGPASAEAVPLLDQLFERRPYLFAKAGWQFAHLHLRSAAPLTLTATFDDYLKTLPPPREDQSNAFGTAVYRAYNNSGGGNDPTLPPPPEKQSEMLAEGLRAMLRAFIEEQRSDETVTRIGDVLVRRLGYKSEASTWLRELARSDPAKAYDAAVELLGLRDGADVDPRAVRLGLNELFADEPGGRPGSAPPGGATLLFKFTPTPAAQIHAIVEKAGKMEEFTTLCDEAIRRGQAGGASAREIGRKEMATRLQLGALAAHDPETFRQRLPKFLKSEDVYARRASDRQAAATLDPALEFVAAAAWKNPALRPQAIEVLRHIATEQQRQRASARGVTDYYYDGGDQQNAGAIAGRLVEMLLATGDKTGACQALRDSWLESVDSLDEGSPYGGQMPGLRISPDRIPELARRYAAAAELLAVVREIRPKLGQRPANDRKMLTAQRALQVQCGEIVTPGIVLAVQPRDENRLILIWQLNRQTLPTPLEALVTPELAKIEAPLRFQQRVEFAVGDDVVAGAGYQVRIENSGDGIQWAALRTVAAAGESGEGRDGIATLDLDAPPGVLRWYRAVLLKGEEVAATSSPVAGLAGPNVLDATGDFWTPTRWSAGTMDIVAVDLPGCKAASLIRVTSAEPLRLEARAPAMIDADRSYVISGWCTRSTLGVAADGPAPGSAAPGSAAEDPNSPVVAPPADAEGDWANVTVKFIGSKNNDLMQTSMQLGAKTLSFTQIVLTPQDDRAAVVEQRWLDRLVGQWGWRAAIPRHAASLRLSINASRNAAFGGLYMSAGAPPEKAGDAAARAR